MWRSNTHQPAIAREYAVAVIERVKSTPLHLLLSRRNMRRNTRREDGASAGPTEAQRNKASGNNELKISIKPKYRDITTMKHRPNKDLSGREMSVLTENVGRPTASDLLDNIFSFMKAETHSSFHANRSSWPSSFRPAIEKRKRVAVVELDDNGHRRYPTISDGIMRHFTPIAS